MTDSVTTAAALASLVVAGLGVYAYTQLGAVDNTHEHDTQTHAQLKENTSAEGGGGARRARRKRKGKTAEDTAETEAKGTAQAGDVDLPGGFEATRPDTPVPPAEPSKKTQKKKHRGGRTHDAARKSTTPTPAPKGGDGETREAAAGDSTDADASVSLEPPASRPARVRAQRDMLRSLSLDTDGSWTHVDRRRLGKPGWVAASSDLASTESSSPIAERVAGGPFAEKLVPRAEGTGVDAMLEESSVSTVARVMPVQPSADETPVPGFSWEDYGDVVEESVLVHDADQEDEGEWGIVKSRNRTRPTQTPTTATPPHPSAAPEAMTKKQRQNARKRELAKAVKADAEAARLEGLAKHKRELERLRIIEQSRQGGGKQTSGGMHATVDDGGKLVWE